MRWLSALVCLALPVAAQALSCRIPDRIDVPRLERAPRGEAAQPMPITGYLLALSWSPQFCASRSNPGDRRDAVQCGDGGGFGWVLHGLWPQGSQGRYPGWCRSARIVPQPVLREHLCMSPSVQLMQRQWAKHGICMSPTPAAYFRASAILYRALRFPDMATLAQSQPTAGSVRRAFAAKNRGLSPAMLAVTADRAGWLQEVRLCLSRQMRPTICQSSQRGLRDQYPVKIRHLVPH